MPHHHDVEACQSHHPLLQSPRNSTHLPTNHQRTFSLCRVLFRLFTLLLLILTILHCLDSLTPLTPTFSPSPLQLHSAVSSTQSSLYYEDCLRSFEDREHVQNDGVTVKVGVFSHWTKVDKRSMIRSTIKQWLPRTMRIDFAEYCDQQTREYRRMNGVEALHSLSHYIPVKSPHSYWPPEPFGEACLHTSSALNHMLDRSWLSVYDHVEFVFVFGAYKTANFTRTAIFEQETTMYGDLEHLDIEEGINGGKSLIYMQKAARENRVRRSNTRLTSTNQYPWDFVLKLDDDSFLHLPHYITQLREFRARRLPEVMYGQLLHYPHTPIPVPVEPSKMPMWAAGAGYTLGADLVDWLISPHFDDVRARLQPILPDEDLVLGEWFRLRGEDLGRDRNSEWTGRTNNRDEAYRRHPCLCANFVNMMPHIYNYPGDALTWSWSRQTQFHPQTVIVHYTKKVEWWQTATEHFMCKQPHRFHWAANETWWKKYPWGELIYKFNDDGSIQYSHEFYDQFHQSYREYKDQQAGFIGEMAIKLDLGNLTLVT